MNLPIVVKELYKPVPAEAMSPPKLKSKNIVLSKINSFLICTQPENGHDFRQLMLRCSALSPYHSRNSQKIKSSDLLISTKHVKS